MPPPPSHTHLFDIWCCWFAGLHPSKPSSSKWTFCPFCFWLYISEGLLTPDRILNFQHLRQTSITWGNKLADTFPIPPDLKNLSPTQAFSDNGPLQVGENTWVSTFLEVLCYTYSLVMQFTFVLSVCLHAYIPSKLVSLQYLGNPLVSAGWIFPFLNIILFILYSLNCWK